MVSLIRKLLSLKAAVYRKGDLELETFSQRDRIELETQPLQEFEHKDNEMLVFSNSSGTLCMIAGNK